MGVLLIADSDRPSRDLLIEELSRDGHQVESAVQGKEVLQRVASGAIDALVVEVHLPDMPAWELIPRIRRLNPDLPIITVTADDSWETSRRVRVEGGSVFFYALKPLNLGELRRVVDSAVDWWKRRRKAGSRTREERVCADMPDAQSEKN